jgi:hypothetical protein
LKGGVVVVSPKTKFIVSGRLRSLANIVVGVGVGVFDGAVVVEVEEVFVEVGVGVGLEVGSEDFFEK